MDVLLFLVLAFFFSWSGAFAYFALGGSVAASSYPLAATVFTLWPAAAACLVEGGFNRRSLTELGLLFRWNRRLFLAWILAPLLILVTVVISLPVMDWTLSPDHPANPLLSALPPKQAALLDRLKPTSTTLFTAAILAAAMLAGATVNLAGGIGEELGWRGFLYRRLRPLGFWPMSWLTGLFWGLWHLPLVLHGHLQGGTPGRALILTVLVTLLLSPILFFLRERGGTVLAPALFHGTFNALGGLPLFVDGGIASAALAVLIAADLSIFLWRRRRERLIAIP